MHGNKRRRWLVVSCCWTWPRLHYEAEGAGGHCVQHGERQAPLAGRGEAVHPDLPHPRRRRHVRLPLGPQLHLPDGDVPEIHHRFDHVPAPTEQITRIESELSPSQCAFHTRARTGLIDPARWRICSYRAVQKQRKLEEGRGRIAVVLWCLCASNRVRVRVLCRFRPGLVGSPCESAAMAAADEFGMSCMRRCRLFFL